MNLFFPTCKETNDKGSCPLDKESEPWNLVETLHISCQKAKSMSCSSLLQVYVCRVTESTVCGQCWNTVTEILFFEILLFSCCRADPSFMYCLLKVGKLITLQLYMYKNNYILLLIPEIEMWLILKQTLQGTVSGKLLSILFASESLAPCRNSVIRQVLNKYLQKKGMNRYDLTLYVLFPP